MALFSRRTDREPEGEDAATADATGGPDLEEIRDVLRRASMGDVDARVVGVPADSDVAGLANDLNRLLDLVDAFLRETDATLAAAEQGRTYRRFLQRGMLGAFALTAQQVNTAAQIVAAADSAQDESDEDGGTEDPREYGGNPSAW